jgi:hypothetical protein
MAAKQDPYTKPDTVSTEDKVTDLLKIVNGVDVCALPISSCPSLA